MAKRQPYKKRGLRFQAPIKPRPYKPAKAGPRTICNGTAMGEYHEPEIAVRDGAMDAYTLPSAGFRT